MHRVRCHLPSALRGADDILYFRFTSLSKLLHVSDDGRPVSGAICHLRRESLTKERLGDSPELREIASSNRQKMEELVKGECYVS